MCTLEIPYENIKGVDMFRKKVIHECVRPPLKKAFPCKTSDQICGLISKCWHADQNQRYDSTLSLFALRSILLLSGKEAAILDNSNATAESYTQGRTM